MRNALNVSAAKRKVFPQTVLLSYLKIAQTSGGVESYQTFILTSPFTIFSCDFKNYCKFVHYIVIISCYIMLTEVKEDVPPAQRKKHDV